MQAGAVAARGAAEKAAEEAQIERLRRENSTLRLVREAAEAEEERLLQGLRAQNKELASNRQLSKGAGAAARWRSKESAVESDEGEAEEAAEGSTVPAPGGKPDAWESASPLLANSGSISSIGIGSVAGAASEAASEPVVATGGSTRAREPMRHADLLVLLPQLQQALQSSLESDGTGHGGAVHAAAAVVETALMAATGEIQRGNYGAPLSCCCQLRFPLS